MTRDCRHATECGFGIQVQILLKPRETFKSYCVIVTQKFADPAATALHWQWPGQAGAAGAAARDRHGSRARTQNGGNWRCTVGTGRNRVLHYIRELTTFPVPCSKLFFVFVILIGVIDCRRIFMPSDSKSNCNSGQLPITKFFATSDRIRESERTPKRTSLAGWEDEWQEGTKGRIWNKQKADETETQEANDRGTPSPHKAGISPARNEVKEASLQAMKSNCHNRDQWPPREDIGGTYFEGESSRKRKKVGLNECLGAQDDILRTVICPEPISEDSARTTSKAPTIPPSDLHCRAETFIPSHRYTDSQKIACESGPPAVDVIVEGQMEDEAILADTYSLQTASVKENTAASPVETDPSGDEAPPCAKDDFVLMPFETSPEGGSAGGPRWERIRRALTPPPRSFDAFRGVVLSYTDTQHRQPPAARPARRFAELRHVLESVLSSAERGDFFGWILPGLVEWALALPELCPKPIPRLSTQRRLEVPPPPPPPPAAAAAAAAL